jgi:hypothetical protein
MMHSILIHDPTTSLFNEYKYRHRGVIGDSEYEDKDTRFCKKYGKQEAGASDSFFVARKEPGDLEPTVKHVQVGEEAIEKAVDLRKNILLEYSQAMLLAARWSTLEDIETFSLFPEILVWTLYFQQRRRNIHSLLELGRTTIGVTFQHFDVTYLLSRYGCLNFLLDT